MDYPDKYSISSSFHLIFLNWLHVEVFNHAFIPFHFFELNTSRGIQFPIHCILYFVLSTLTSIQSPAHSNYILEWTTSSSIQFSLHSILYFWMDYPDKFSIVPSFRFIFLSWIPLGVFNFVFIPFYFLYRLPLQVFKPHAHSFYIFEWTTPTSI